MKLILASTSKLKNEILDKVRMKHESINSDFEEKSSNKNNVYKYVKDLSFGKAKSVEEKVGQAIILGIDTIVYANEKILEKCLPPYLEKDLENLKKGIKNKVSYLDCLIDELQGSVNSAFVDGDITEEQCDYLYKKYIRMEK